MSNPNSNDALWESALSTRKRLKDVRRDDLVSEFYGKNDPRGTNVFGGRYQGKFVRPAWEEHAIRVADDQVFFARLVTNRSSIYVVQLGEWQYFTNAAGGHNGRIRAAYVVVPTRLPEAAVPANRSRAIRSD